MINLLTACIHMHTAHHITPSHAHAGGLMDYPPPPDWGRYVDQSNNPEVHFACTVLEAQIV